MELFNSKNKIYIKYNKIIVYKPLSKLKWSFFKAKRDINNTNSPTFA